MVTKFHALREINHMNYNFDEIISRKNTHSLKYDFNKERGMPENVLPLWVADMDFRAPNEVIEKLTEISAHGIFGYSDVKEDYFLAIRDWFSDGFGYTPHSEWLVKTPGIVFAIAMAIKAFTNKGDAILIQTPVYYPFAETVTDNERVLIDNPLIYQDGAYSIDFNDFEQKIIKHNVKLFLLCSPHNPVGRVWTVQELKSLGEICQRHNCIILSDEIHCDFTYEGHKHHVLGSLSEQFSHNTIICTAPSKTFNLAGLQVSNIFIADPDKRQRFKQEINKAGYSQLNVMGLLACQTAYQYGKPWLEALKTYLTGNLNFTKAYLKQHLPRVKLVEPEGTYLLWLDFSELNLSQTKLNSLIINKTNLWLDDGVMFGATGKGFQRINMACPRLLLEKALQQLTIAEFQN